MENRSVLVRNAAIAAIVGSACGALAGVWSVYRPPAFRTPVAPVPATTAVVVASSTTPPRVQTIEPVSVRHEAPPAVTAAAPPARALEAPVVAPASNAAVAAGPHDVLERARALAQRPDVKALVALRENVVLRAAARGEKDSAATKEQVDELDRYVAEARALRLKIDALEFRKAAPEPAMSRVRD
jgi:hypothetical protein